MSSVTISVRLPTAEVERLDKLARELGTARPTFLRQALKRGAQDLMFERACQAYRTGEATLTHAAELAGISLPEMLLRMKDANLQLNYGIDELQRDLRP
jgi:predicted HTH domain antitoxin